MNRTAKQILGKPNPRRCAPMLSDYSIHVDRANKPARLVSIGYRMDEDGKIRHMSVEPVHPHGDLVELMEIDFELSHKKHPVNLDELKIGRTENRSGENDFTEENKRDTE